MDLKQSNGNQPINVFYSYSHLDEEFRKSLETHLGILRRKGLINEWHDRKIIPGKEWEPEIDSGLNNSDLILLLVSPDFINSDYCYGIEMNRAMELHESNNAVVVPIIIRPTEITDEPFSRIQALPTDAKPITLWDDNDLAWLDVVKGLKLTIAEIQKDIQENIRRSLKSDNSLKSIHALLSREVERIDSLYESEGSKCSGIATGFYDLDAKLDGLNAADFWVVAARPGMGKTDFSLSLLENIAIDKKVPVAFFSTQLPSSKVIRKLISSIGRLDSHHQLKGNLTDDDWPRLTSAISIIASMESNIFINDKPEMTIEELSQSIRELQAEHGIGALILDGLHNITIDKNNENVEVDKISRNIKILARELNLPIIATLHISRQLEQRVDKRPYLSDLKNWDALQNDADAIMFLYRDEVYNEDSQDRGTAELIIAKSNDGLVGKTKLVYAQRYSRFDDFTP